MVFWTPPPSIIAEMSHLMTDTEFPDPNSYDNSTHSKYRFINYRIFSFFSIVLAAEGLTECLFYLPSSSVWTLMGLLAGPFPTRVEAETLMS